METVGIPRAMYYFEYGELWENFFGELGFFTVVSDKTDDKILANGIKYASSDLCLPIKAAFGHVNDLLDRADRPDRIFLPGIRKPEKECFSCPKAIGLNAMLKGTFGDKLPGIISPWLNGSVKKMLEEASKELGAGKRRGRAAYKAAVKKQKPKESVKYGAGFTAAVAGHSYMLGDNRLNMDIEARLNRLGVSVIRPGDCELTPEKTGAFGYKRPFWHSAKTNLGFTKYIADNQAADGMIFINSFGCGTDALSTGICADYLRRTSRIPSVCLSFDEHTGEAGLNTRLEAFCDCMEYGRRKAGRPKDVIA